MYKAPVLVRCHFNQPKEPAMGINFSIQVVSLVDDQESPIVWAYPFFDLYEKWTSLARQLKELRQEAPTHYQWSRNGSHQPIRKYVGDRNLIRPEQLANLDFGGASNAFIDILRTIARWSGEEYALIVGFDDEQN